MLVEAPIRADLDSRNIVPSEQLVDRSRMDPKVIGYFCRRHDHERFEVHRMPFLAEGQETRKEKHTCGGGLSTGTLRFIHRHASQLDATPACARERFNRDSKTGIYSADGALWEWLDFEESTVSAEPVASTHVH